MAEKKGKMWVHKNDPAKQIYITRNPFKVSKEWEWDLFTEDKCPIPLHEFCNYDFPLEVVEQGFNRIKNYMKDFVEPNFISFFGLK